MKLQKIHILLQQNIDNELQTQKIRLIENIFFSRRHIIAKYKLIRNILEILLDARDERNIKTK